MSSRNGTMKKGTVENKIEEKIKSQVDKHLKIGKNKLMQFEEDVLNGKHKKELEAQWEKSKKKLGDLKKKYSQYEKKTASYVKKNPRKALAVATAAGLLVGAVISSMNKKK